jgi:hypothetical protein
VARFFAATGAVPAPAAVPAIVFFFGAARFFLATAVFFPVTSAFFFAARDLPRPLAVAPANGRFFTVAAALAPALPVVSCALVAMLVSPTAYSKRYRPPA